MFTQAYAHQCFAYATGPYKDPNTKHKHGGLKRGSYELEWFGNFGVIWAYHSEYTMEITFDLVWFGNIILNIPDVTVVFHMVTSYYPPSQQSVSVSQEFRDGVARVFEGAKAKGGPHDQKTLFSPGHFFGGKGPSLQ